MPSRRTWRGGIRAKLVQASAHQGPGSPRRVKSPDLIGEVVAEVFSTKEEELAIGGIRHGIGPGYRSIARVRTGCGRENDDIIPIVAISAVVVPGTRIFPHVVH